MADNKIEVEYVATVAGALNAIEKLNKRLDSQEQKLQRVGDTSKKAAEGAVNSFNKLEAELKQNEAKLKSLTLGTKEFSEQKKRVDALRQSVAGAKDQLGGLASKANAGLSAGISKVAQLAAGMVGFQSIVTAVVAELEKAKQLKLESAATMRTLEQAIADVGQNIGAEAVPQARQMIMERAPELGVTQEGLANLLGVAISAGAKDLEEAMSLSAAALKITVGDATKALTLVGGTLDVASLGGSTNFEGALGQLLQTQSQVRSTNLAEFAANIGPGLAAATSKGQNTDGVTTERALEVAATISQIIKDPTGSNTATTMRQFFTRLDSFTPEREVQLDDGSKARVSPDVIKQFQQTTGFDDRLKMMRGNEGLMLQFLETQRESIGKTAVREIIGGSDRAVAFEDKAKAAIASIDEAKPFFDDLVKAINENTVNLQAQRQFDAGIQAAQTDGTVAIEGQARAIYEQALDKIDIPGFDYGRRMLENRDLDQALYRGTSPVQAVREQLVHATTPIGLGEKPISREAEAILASALKSLDKLQIALDRMEANQRAVPFAPQINVNVKAPPMRPKEAPLPAATAP